MFTALMAKFSQHPKLRFELLNTNNAKIIEHTKNDSYWEMEVTIQEKTG